MELKLHVDAALELVADGQLRECSAEDIRQFKAECGDADFRVGPFAVKRVAGRFDYPDETPGSRLAADVRAKANGLTARQREELFRAGMRMIGA